MTKFKSLLLGSAGALLLTSSAALAADQPRAPQRTPVWACDITGFWELPGTDVCFKVGGYAKADLIITLDPIANGANVGQSTGGDSEDLTFGALALAAIARGAPANQQGDGDDVRLHARQSRVNFDARTNTSYGTVRAFIEGDFFSGDRAGATEVISNRSSLTLRHAFIQFGNLLAGQTWGALMNLPALFETLDFGGAGALSFTRAGQVRWTQPVGNGVSLVLAIENPDNMDAQRAGGIVGTVLNDDLPDFIAKIVVSQEWGHLELAGVFRDMEGTPIPGFLGGIAREDGVGYAVMFSGRINVPIANGKDDIRFNVMYSEGGTRYVLDGALMGLTNGVNEGSREWNAAGRLYETFAVSAGYRHWWTDQLRTNIVGSYTEIDNLLGAGSADTTTSLWVNLIWSPVPRVDMGIEYIYQELELVNGVNADYSRIQASISRSF